MERDYAGSRTLRDAHPKMHGCVRGELVDRAEPAGAPAHRDLRAAPRTFPAWVRFSNQSGTVSPDSKGDIRGVAIKLMGVAGQKLEMTGTDDTTHDFILISDSRFVTKDVAQFDGLVSALTGGLVKIAWFFLTHPRAARNLWFSLKRFGNPLGIRYFSVVPYLLGRTAVKYSLIPGHALDARVPNDPSADYLREAMVQHLSARGAVFDFSVQLQADPDTMPIEDPGITWDETASPFQKVATLTIASQVFDTPERREFGDNLSFNPWRCLPEHRPLGGISRARRQVYRALSTFRHERNAAPAVEPTVGGSAAAAAASPHPRDPGPRARGGGRRRPPQRRADRELAGKGFSVLGFPSNDFGGQEPGTPQEIATFCKLTYDVTFPMFSKLVTKTGAEQSPIYRYLGTSGHLPAWNFGKYLVGKDGRVLAFFPSEVTPEAPELRRAITNALGSN